MALIIGFFRWIGSVNAFFLVSGGVVAGRLYDRGYLSVPVFGSSLFILFTDGPEATSSSMVVP